MQESRTQNWQKKIQLCMLENLLMCSVTCQGNYPKTDNSQTKLELLFQPKQYLLTTLQLCALFIPPSRASECPTSVYTSINLHFASSEPLVLNSPWDILLAGNICMAYCVSFQRFEVTLGIKP